MAKAVQEPEEVTGEVVRVKPAKKAEKRTIDIEIDKSIKVTDSKKGIATQSIHEEVHLELDEDVQQQGLFDAPDDTIDMIE